MSIVFRSFVVPTTSALAIALVVAACGKSDEPRTTAAPARSAPTASAPPPAAPSATPAPPAPSAAAPATAPAAEGTTASSPAAPAASGATAPSGAPVAAPPAAAVLGSEELAPAVTVEIVQLKRDPGGTVTLRFAIANQSKDNVRIDSYFSDQSWTQWNVAKVALLDVANKKKYLVVRDSEKNCVCSRGTADDYQVKPGSRRVFWVKFPAPPADVGKITIEMPGTPPFESVPIAS